MSDYPWCEVYWGSHACKLMPGHNGFHICECCPDPQHHATDPNHDPHCVGAPPYYGPDTVFFGSDVPVQWRG